MTKVPPKPEPVIAADGSVAVVLRDEVIVWLEPVSGARSAVRVPFAARRVAVAPNGRRIVVAGSGEVAVLDRDSGGFQFHRVPVESPQRIAIDDIGTVVLSSSVERRVARLAADGRAESVDVPEGFHESLVLVPNVGAHVVISGATTLSAVISFGAGLMQVDDPAPQGALPIGRRLGIYSTELLQVFDVAASGYLSEFRSYPLNGVERLVANSVGSEAVSVAWRWDGSTDVVRVEGIDLSTGNRTEIPEAIGRWDALALAGNGLVRAFGTTRPPTLTTVVNDVTFSLNIAAAVAEARS